MWYPIVEKETGVMIGGVSNFTDHLNRPIPDSLAYVPLNDLLIKLLTTDGSDLGEELHVVDYTQTAYDFAQGKWNIVYHDPEPQVDPFQVAEKLKETKIAEATRKLALPDLSTSAKEKLQAYIDQLTALVIDSTTAKNDTEWPKAPF